MKLPPRRILEGIAEVNAREVAARTRKAAEQREGLVAVCLIGPKEPIPRHFGDNMGGCPVRIVVTLRERGAAKEIDLAQPYAKFEVLEFIKVESRAHAERMKAAIDTMLLGAQAANENDQPRHSFRDVRGCFESEAERMQWWGELVKDATRIVLKEAREFAVYSPAQAKAKVAGAARSFGRRG